MASRAIPTPEPPRFPCDVSDCRDCVRSWKTNEREREVLEGLGKDPMLFVECQREGYLVPHVTAKTCRDVWPRGQRMPSQEYWLDEKLRDQPIHTIYNMLFPTRSTKGAPKGEEDTAKRVLGIK